MHIYEKQFFFVVIYTENKPSTNCVPGQGSKSKCKQKLSQNHTFTDFIIKEMCS